MPNRRARRGLTSGPNGPAAAVTVPAAITGGDAPTEAEHNALRAAVAALAAACAAAGITL